MTANKNQSKAKQFQAGTLLISFLSLFLLVSLSVNGLKALRANYKLYMAYVHETRQSSCATSLQLRLRVIAAVL